MLVLTGSVTRLQLITQYDFHVSVCNKRICSVAIVGTITPLQFSPNENDSRQAEPCLSHPYDTSCHVTTHSGVSDSANSRIAE